MNNEIGSTIMCRACMKVDGVLLPMYGDDMISKKNLPDKLADLASIEINKYDGLPTVLCAKCAYRTDSFYDFKLQVQATEKKLRKMFQSSNVQSVSVKTEVAPDDWGNEKYLSSDFLLQTKKHSLDNEWHSANILEEHKSIDESVETVEVTETMDVKPIIDDDFCEKTHGPECYNNYPEPVTLRYAEEPTEENNHLSSLQNLNEIFIPNMSEVMNDHCDKDGTIKNEVPDDIKNLLQSQNLGYTFLYITAEDAIALGEQENHHTIRTDEQSDGPLNDENVRIFDSAFQENLSSEDNAHETEKMNEESASSSVKDSFSAEDALHRKRNWKTTIPYDNFVDNKDVKTIEPKSSNIILNNDTSANNNGENDSDSDYFVDPKDNLLGSLNDTIMRIKEIKVEGSEMHYQCTLCMQNYNKLTGVLIHTVDNHVPSSGPFFCVVCEKDCETHRELRTHVKTHSGQFPYTCFICNKAYSMKRYLKRHMSCHTDFPRHRCPKCGTRFNAKSELETHIGTHVQGGAPFACSQCPRLFNHKGNYKRHLISHLDPHGLHLPKYPCEVCGKRFLNNRTLETHMRVHTGEKPFQCNICSRSFSQQGNLLNHLRIHSNPRSYTCEVCGKRFNQRATLRDHSLLHTGEKPYVCNVCGVAFTFSAALRRHMWTHATDKPFGCEICNARFVGKYDIKRHMKIHTDRPKIRRRANQSRNEENRRENSRNEENRRENSRNETTDTTQVSSDTQTIFIEQVLLTQDATQIVTREESEKENVDALFNLIQYG